MNVPPHTSAILLAAGLSTRMGRNKALLPWLDSTLLEYQLRQLVDSQVEDVILVLGHEADKLQPVAIKFPQAQVVFNPLYGTGRSSSVVTGASAVDPETEAVLVYGVDQPRPAALIDEVIQAYAASPGPITIPTFQGRRGHPVLFSASIIDEIREISEENQGLKEVVHRDPTRVKEVAVSSPMTVLDLNTPEDYKQGLEMVKKVS